MLVAMMPTIINIISIIRIETWNVSLSFPTVTECDPWFVIIIMMGTLPCIAQQVQ